MSELTREQVEEELGYIVHEARYEVEPEERDALTKTHAALLYTDAALRAEVVAAKGCINRQAEMITELRVENERLEQLRIVTDKSIHALHDHGATLTAENERLKDTLQAYKEDLKETARDARETAQEQYWKGKQGEDYGSY